MAITSERMQFKVRGSDGAMRMQTHAAEDAAMCVAFLGDGATVTHGNDRKFLLWTQGNDGDGDAGDSYDSAAAAMHRRIADEIARHKAIRAQLWNRTA